MRAERLAPAALREQLLSESEVALIDVRPREAFLAGHFLLAVNVPARRIPDDLPRPVPGRRAEILLDHR